MTPDDTGETVDGMSREKISTMIDLIRWERWRWAPVKRVYIPKRNGKLRPLGLPSWSSKILQEVIRQLLEAYYEPRFSNHSHGFRPGRGCHTALSKIVHTWKGVHWFIEGDISDCFGRLDHSVLLNILRETIHDNRFLRLVQSMLQAGYLEEWRWHETLSGAPQGGVCSPIREPYLPGQTGQVRRDGADAKVQPGRTQETKPCLPTDQERHRPCQAAGGSASTSSTAKATA